MTHSTPIREPDKEDLEADLLLFGARQERETNKKMNWNLLYGRNTKDAQKAQRRHGRERSSPLSQRSYFTTYIPELSSPQG